MMIKKPVQIYFQEERVDYIVIEVTTGIQAIKEIATNED